jgi:hypothetical protein
LIFAPVNDWRLAFDKFEPAVPEGIHPRRRDHFDVVKGETVAVLHLLRHDEGLHIAEGRNLPVNVEHFRFEKCCAVTCYDQFRHDKRGTT